MRFPASPSPSSVKTPRSMIESKDGVVRWRCVDLRVKIVAHFAVTFHQRSVARLLRKLDLTRLQPRPYHPKNDAAAQGAFKKTLPAW